MTPFATETADAVLALLKERGLIASAWLKAVPDAKIAVRDAAAELIDEKARHRAQELREFVAWWMRIIHHDHAPAQIPHQPDWRKCPANVCKSTWESMQDLGAREVESAEPAQVPA